MTSDLEADAFDLLPGPTTLKAIQRDNGQSKTFTKWINQQLKQTGREISCLFEDLKDGSCLAQLVEKLIGETVTYKPGKLRLNRLDNVQNCLQALKQKGVKLINIQAEEIVNGNHKQTLALVWVLILSTCSRLENPVDSINNNSGELGNVTFAKKSLLAWVNNQTDRFPCELRITDFSRCWKDGLAFNAILNHCLPHLVTWDNVLQLNPAQRLENAFTIVEQALGISGMLDPEDFMAPDSDPDETTVFTYVLSLSSAVEQQINSEAEPTCIDASNTIATNSHNVRVLVVALVTLLAIVFTYALRTLYHYENGKLDNSEL